MTWQCCLCYGGPAVMVFLLLLRFGFGVVTVTVRTCPCDVRFGKL